MPLFSYAYLMPSKTSPSGYLVQTSTLTSAQLVSFNFLDFINTLDEGLAKTLPKQPTLKEPSAILVAVSDTSKEDIDSSLEELKALCLSAGIKVVGTCFQRRAPHPRTYVGEGKLEELYLESLRLGANMLVFNTELTPSQWRTITNKTDLLVLDRSMVILDIFAQRVHSVAGKVQVELAQLRYNYPRLTEMDSGLSRLTGGIGARGPGETKLEISRRRVLERIKLLEKRLQKLKKNRAVQGKRRKESSIPIVSIVGYTNAGKSSLFNCITASSVLVEDKLFATLDPTRRKVILSLSSFNEDLEGNFTFILSDTVGFIRELPKELQEAFSATLDELKEASLLLHVIDISDKEALLKAEAVLSLLKELGLSHIPIINVLNKCDKAETFQIENLTKALKAIPISALKKEGIEKLLKEIVKVLVHNGTAALPRHTLVFSSCCFLSPLISLLLS